MSGTTSVYEQVYSILDRHSLADFDCGDLCGKLCCCYLAAGDDESGVELLPGEEDNFPLEAEWHKPRFLSQSLYEYPPDWIGRSGLFQIKCLKACPREKRPVNCRLFPFQLYREGDGYYLALIGAGCQYICALIEKPELINQKFVESVKEAAALLLEIPEVRQLVDWDSMNIEKDYIRMKIGL